MVVERLRSVSHRHRLVIEPLISPGLFSFHPQAARLYPFPPPSPRCVPARRQVLVIPIPAASQQNPARTLLSRYAISGPQPSGCLTFDRQARASRFLKNLSNFARGKKKSSDTCPYNSSDWHGRPKPCLSQPALVLSDLSPEQDESSSSVSPSPQSRSSPLSGGAPNIFSARTQSLDLLTGRGRNEGASGPVQPTSAARSRLSPLKTISRNGQSPQFLTSTTSPASGRSVSFDIPRSPLNKDDKRLKLNGFEPMSPYVNPPGNLADVSEDRSPCQVTDNSSLNLPGIGCSSATTNLLSRAPKIDGLPNPTEPIDSSFFACTQPAAQSPADEIPNLTPDRTPTPPFRSPMPPKPPNYHEATNSPLLTPANISPAIIPPKRAALLRLPSLPPPAFTMNGEGGGVRFSPTPIGRHFPTAVLPLPPTSIARRSTSPAPSLRSNASHARLRSVPALAMDGTEDGGGDGDGSDDEDDNDDDHVPITLSPTSEDEDDDATTERDGSSMYVSANASPVESCPDPSSPFGRVDADKTQVPKPPQDYFSIHPARSGFVDRMASNSKQALLSPRERPRGLYHQPSKSMVNLLRRDLSIIDEEMKGKVKATDSASSAVVVEGDVPPEGSRIQRRRSLPMFTAATEPPPYPSLDIPSRSAAKVFPRDEEGKEKLPKYSNDVFLSAVLPRKLEFSSPGVQARDRKWRRMLCVLEGTAFRVFEPPVSAVGIGAVGRWWEKKVGVGDLTSDAPLPKKAITMTAGSQKIDQDLEADEGRSIVGPTPSVASSKKPKPYGHGLLHLSGNTSGASSRRQSGETSREDGRNGLLVPAPRPSVSSITVNTTGRPSISSHKRAPSPMFSKPGQPEHAPYTQNCPPLQEYTLQHAESGLASDYLKRKNVIRVRMEGEQFLLQAPSVPAVVDWIEASF